MLKLKNYTEEVVANALPNIISEIGSCKCEHCKYDIMAIALNNLRSKYVVTDEGEVYARLASYSQSDVAKVTTEIVNAIKIVDSSPRH